MQPRVLMAAGVSAIVQSSIVLSLIYPQLPLVTFPFDHSVPEIRVNTNLSTELMGQIDRVLVKANRTLFILYRVKDRAVNVSAGTYRALAREHFSSYIIDALPEQLKTTLAPDHK